MRQDGFVLADALAALLIAALFLTSLTVLAHHSIIQGISANNRLMAAYIARGLADPAAGARQSGTVAAGGQQFQWAVHPAPRASQPKDAVIIEDLVISVSWQTPSGRTDTLEAVSVRLRPGHHGN